MGRPPRPSGSGQVVHVTARFFGFIMADELHHGGAPCFPPGDTREAFMSILRDVLERLDVSLYAFVLMGNHYHLVIGFPVDAPEHILSRFLHLLHNNFAHWYNRSTGHEGQVIRERVKTPIIEGPEQLGATLAYLHHNPVRAGLCATPGDWGHSSFEALSSGWTAGAHVSLLGRSPAALGIERFATVTESWLKDHLTPGVGHTDAPNGDALERYRKSRCRLVEGSPEFRAKMHDSMGLPRIRRGPWAVKPETP